MFADDIRVNLPVAFDNRIGQTQRHRGVIGKLRAVEIAGRVILCRPGKKRSIQPKCALTRFLGHSSDGMPIASPNACP
jgi:hypothetical protein